MKSRVRSSSPGSPPPPPPPPSFYTYLKPGALAKLRYCKITARSKEIGAQTLLDLCELKSSSDSAFSQAHSTGLSMDAVPCFNSRRISSFPRCIQRKKLIAVMPFFPQTQS